MFLRVQHRITRTLAKPAPVSPVNAYATFTTVWLDNTRDWTKSSSEAVKKSLVPGSAPEGTLLLHCNSVASTLARSVPEGIYGFAGVSFPRLSESGSGGDEL